MRLVTRAEWGARPPRAINRGAMKAKPTLHWNGPTVTVSGSTTWDHRYCASLVRGVQNYHMDAKGWNDIAYNFVGCPHGYTFEGRGINVWNGANGTTSGNRSSIALMSLSGELNPFPMSEKVGIKEGFTFISARAGAPLGAQGHRDHKATACPGEARYVWLKNGMPTSGSSDGGTTPKPPTKHPVPSSPNTNTILRLGVTSDDVAWVQSTLNKKASQGLVVDGIYGSATAESVRRLQSLFGLSVDGVVGQDTWKALLFLAGAPQKPQTNPVVKMGSRGASVTKIQNILRKKAGQKIKVDGIFGRDTDGAVRNLQKLFNLKVDGIVGKDTWAAVEFINRAR